MLFNSYVFIFAFLPIVLCGYHFISRHQPQLSAPWLVMSSLVFYSWWNTSYLLLLLLSVIFNYVTGSLLGHTNPANTFYKKSIFSLGVLANVALLGYYKYAHFVTNNLNLVFHTSFHFEKIILPLAISFFTFQQIAYLVDAYRGETKEYDFLRYCLFVTFFPQLIAGPIVHHKEMMPQLSRALHGGLKASNLAPGIALFIVGLFKKVIIADTLAEYASPVFAAAETSYNLSFSEAWIGALAYTLQLYFDFSGYADMALGLGRMFGVYLPINFLSPYKAKNIAEFWRHWHMTLSRFLRDYIYFPLGGNRNGHLKALRNLTITMLIGGIWHGAGWTFTIWGLTHGLLLAGYYVWRKFTAKLTSNIHGWLPELIALLTTQVIVVLTWVLFRAETLTGAGALYRAILGLNGFVFPDNLLEKIPLLAPWLVDHGILFKSLAYLDSSTTLFHLFIGFVFVMTAPNTMQIFAAGNTVYYDEVSPSRIQFKLNIIWLVLISWMAFYSVAHLTRITEFLYFNF
jgi:D-alanyl-lipoteichoic acid acyltransferase DltB (MBOAT superfamily)